MWFVSLGKTCGLCGNFNDDQSDDFTTPEGDVVVNTQDFGDSWKTDNNCPDTKISPHPCTIRNDRYVFKIYCTNFLLHTILTHLTFGQLFFIIIVIL